MHPKSSAEQLQEMSKLVKWTLWKIATEVVEVSSQTRGDAEDLFNNPVWVANVVGQFAANQASERSTIDWSEFMEKFDG